MDLRLLIKRMPQRKFDRLSHLVIFSILPLSIGNILLMLSNNGSNWFFVFLTTMITILIGHSAACKYMLWARYSCDVCKEKHCLEHWDQSERPGK